MPGSLKFFKKKVNLSTEPLYHSKARMQSAIGESSSSNWTTSVMFDLEIDKTFGQKCMKFHEYVWARGTGNLPQGSFGFYVFKNGVYLDRKTQNITSWGSFDLYVSLALAAGQYKVQTMGNEVYMTFDVSAEGQIISCSVVPSGFDPVVTNTRY